MGIYHGGANVPIWEVDETYKGGTLRRGRCEHLPSAIPWGLQGNPSAVPMHYTYCGNTIACALNDHSNL